MPFLFWMPLIVMRGLWQAAQADAQMLFDPPAPQDKNPG